MKSRKPNDYVSGPLRAEHDSPFSELKEQWAGQCAPTPPPRKQDAEPHRPPVPATPAFTIGRTRKGGYPVFLEKRAHHVVTVLRQISGDVDTLLRLLKRRLGAGGALRGDSIELQGDHRDQVMRLLTEVTRGNAGDASGMG